MTYFLFKFQFIAQSKKAVSAVGRSGAGAGFPGLQFCQAATNLFCLPAELFHRAHQCVQLVRSTVIVLPFPELIFQLIRCGRQRQYIVLNRIDQQTQAGDLHFYGLQLLHGRLIVGRRDGLHILNNGSDLFLQVFQCQLHFVQFRNIFADSLVKHAHIGKLG